ncbi:HPF/RaiA family ribosome-associated protein [Lentzea sp. NBC_00516]|uniref:HPF/RaiA family ribosome-associated protein n=1 Tax=Lentzea sp. NBC_00516 TaxID=2903582 RepID=UPI002E821F69|nr:HPF/RaiA family ribosome-associated protein [Lentzea sp. NBC_00516]WUD25751.1 HPF/RaiA family ribosome-associated protein [Lentzea sp. NBC_00516]
MDYIQVSLAEAIPEQARDYASARIGSLDRYAPARVDFAWVNLTSDKSVIHAHARLDLQWVEVQAYAEAGTVTEVIDLVRERMRRQLVSMHGVPAHN